MIRDRRRPASPPASPRTRLLVVLATLALAGFALWRVGIGADVSDGTHVVALAMRMAQGDHVLADEMNLQALGSLAAVPFTYAWLQLVGVESIVLASRVFYLVLAFGTGVLVYRALRTRLPAAAALPAAVLMLLPTPYNLLVTSYNSVPVLALGLAAAAGFAAVSTGSGRWAALCGVALAVAVLSHPSSLPAAAVLALTLLLLVRRREVVVGLLSGGGAASLLVVAALALGPGLAALQDTIVYTLDYQSERAFPLERGRRALLRFLEGLFGRRHLPALLLALVAVLPLLSWRARAVAALGIPVAVAVAAVAVAPPTIVGVEPFGLLSGAFALLLTTLLLVPVAVWAHRTVERDVRLLVVLTLPLAVVGVVSFSMLSSAGVFWGVAAPPVQPLLGALGAGVVLWAGRHGSRLLGAVAALALVGSLLAVHPLRSFQNPDPRHLTGRVAEGPLAGLLTDDRYLAVDCQLRAVTRTWLGPGDSVLFYARPGGYAYSEARMDTNIVWIDRFGPANAVTVDWWERTGRRPDVAVLHAPTVRAAGGWDALAAEDPLVAVLDADYGLPTTEGDYVVLRRDGSVREPVGPAPGCPAP